MVYTEVKERDRRIYFYRVLSVRKGKKISKKRKYLGVNLSKDVLFLKEKEADNSLILKKKDVGNKRNIESIKPKIIAILRHYKIKKAGIFGSYARGDIKKSSDIDILVEPAKGMGFNFFGMNLELEEKLGKKVDLVTYKGLSPYLKDRILSQEMRII